MAKKPETLTFEPDAEYIVRLNRVVPFGALKLRPSQEVRLKGAACAKIADAIESAVKAG